MAGQTNKGVDAPRKSFPNPHSPDEPDGQAGSGEEPSVRMAAASMIADVVTTSQANLAPIRDAMRTLETELAPMLDAIQAWKVRLSPEIEKFNRWSATITIRWPEIQQRLDAIGEVIEALEDSSDPGAQLLSELLNHQSLHEIWQMLPYLKRPPKKRGRKRGKTESQSELEKQAYINLVADGKKPSMKVWAAEIGRLTGRNNADQVENIRRNLYRREKV